MDTGKNQGHLRSLITTTLDAGSSDTAIAEMLGRKHKKEAKICKNKQILNKPLFPLPASSIL